MSSRLLVNQLNQYIQSFPAEKNTTSGFLRFVRDHDDCFLRSNLAGHVTGSAWIINPEASHCLLIHHRKLGRWLQPGGHADGCSETVTVARKEALEETGVRTLRLLQPEIFDVDIHTIPARGDVPEHLHYDVRYVFVALPGEETNDSAETNQVRWWKLDEAKQLIRANDSILRMIDKTRKLTVR